MRIHINATEANVRAAAKAARATIARLSEHGSRTRERAFEVILAGESSRVRNGGRYGAEPSDKAATWDQWGVFLAALYAVDPGASCWAYNSADGFHTLTGGRFVNGWPDDAHGDHSWAWRAGGGKCRRCSARQVRT